MSADKSTAVSKSTSKAKIDWAVIVFFVIVYGIAWGLILVFNFVAETAGVEDGMTLMAITESLELEAITSQLPVPGWFLYLLT